MRVTILGCGASGGVPLPGCDCGVCRSGDPRNRRRRSSVLVEEGGAALLIDASPDLRDQLLCTGTMRLDAVLFTHAHADHCHGIDDLRLIVRLMRRPLDVWGDAATLAELDRRFGYCFVPPRPDEAWFRPVLNPRPIEGPFEAAGLTVVPFRQRHGERATTLGFRIGGFAYSTDVDRLPEEAFSVLDGVEAWVVDSQGYKENFVHSHVAQTLAWIDRVRPRRAVLTHMGHELDYARLAAELPPGVEPARDGLVIEI